MCAFCTQAVQSTALALTLTQSSIFADINKNMLAQNGNSDLSYWALIERQFIIPIGAFNQTSISKYEPCWGSGVGSDCSHFCHKQLRHLQIDSPVRSVVKGRKKCNNKKNKKPISSNGSSIRSMLK